MAYEVTRWLPAIVKAVAGTFCAWSLSRRQAASTKQFVLQALFMWTGNDIGHANWWMHIYHASSRAGQLILKQGLNIQATENEIYRVMWIFRRSVDKSVTVQNMNVSTYCMFLWPFIPVNNVWKQRAICRLGGYFRGSLLFCVTDFTASLLVLRSSYLSRDYSCYM